jgi:hypothetical protein
MEEEESNWDMRDLFRREALATFFVGESSQIMSSNVFFQIRSKSINKNPQDEKNVGKELRNNYRYR